MARAFPSTAVIARVNEEPAIGLGAGRALVMQLAHPHVAAGVAEHSDFQHNPFKRLLGTLEAVYAMVYGSAELADGVGQRVQWIHTFVRSEVYEANDPANLLWVHATLLETALSCYEQIVQPLTAADRETYYEQMTEVAVRFGCPRDQQPATYADFAQYWDEQVATMRVTDEGRRLVRDVIEPARMPLRLDVVLKPLLSVFRIATLGATPPVIRGQLGYSWTARDQRRFDRLYAFARTYHRVVPRPLRVGPGISTVAFCCGRPAATSRRSRRSRLLRRAPAAFEPPPHHEHTDCKRCDLIPPTLVGEQERELQAAAGTPSRLSVGPIISTKLSQ